MGRSRGGLTTKIHALVDANGLPILLKLTEGQAHDEARTPALAGEVEPSYSLFCRMVHPDDRDVVRAGDVVAVLAPSAPAMIDTRTRSVLQERVGSADAALAAAAANARRLQAALALIATTGPMVQIRKTLTAYLPEAIQ
mgnify:CR=1 FL=1